MSIIRTFALLTAMLCIYQSSAPAGICKLGSSCGDCGQKSRCPSDYCCVPECKSEKVMRSCYETDCEAVVIPPVTLPCCKCSLKKLFRKGGCSEGGCGSCDNGCCNDSLLHKLCSKFTKCRVRCVNTYSKKEYERGTKCVCEWKAVCKSSCGTTGCGTTPCSETEAQCEPECCVPSGCR